MSSSESSNTPLQPQRHVSQIDTRLSVQRFGEQTRRSVYRSSHTTRTLETPPPRDTQGLGHQGQTDETVFEVDADGVTEQTGNNASPQQDLQSPNVAVAYDIPEFAPPPVFATPGTLSLNRASPVPLSPLATDETSQASPGVSASQNNAASAVSVGIEPHVPSSSGTSGPTAGPAPSPDTLSTDLPASPAPPNSEPRSSSVVPPTASPARSPAGQISASPALIPPVMPASPSVVTESLYQLETLAPPRRRWSNFLNFRRSRAQDTPSHAPQPAREDAPTGTQSSSSPNLPTTTTTTTTTTTSSSSSSSSSSPSSTPSPSPAGSSSPSVPSLRLPHIASTPRPSSPFVDLQQPRSTSLSGSRTASPAAPSSPTFGRASPHSPLSRSATPTPIPSSPSPAAAAAPPVTTTRRVGRRLAAINSELEGTRALLRAQQLTVRASTRALRASAGGSRPASPFASQPPSTATPSFTPRRSAAVLGSQRATAAAAGDDAGASSSLSFDRLVDKCLVTPAQWLFTSGSPRACALLACLVICLFLFLLLPFLGLSSPFLANRCPDPTSSNLTQSTAGTCHPSPLQRFRALVRRGWVAVFGPSKRKPEAPSKVKPETDYLVLLSLLRPEVEQIASAQANKTAASVARSVLATASSDYKAQLEALRTELLMQLKQQSSSAPQESDKALEEQVQALVTKAIAAAAISAPQANSTSSVSVPISDIVEQTKLELLAEMAKQLSDVRKSVDESIGELSRNLTAATATQNELIKNHSIVLDMLDAELKASHSAAADTHQTVPLDDLRRAVAADILRMGRESVASRAGGTSTTLPGHTSTESEKMNDELQNEMNALWEQIRLAFASEIQNMFRRIEAQVPRVTSPALAQTLAAAPISFIEKPNLASIDAGAEVSSHSALFDRRRVFELISATGGGRGKYAKTPAAEQADVPYTRGMDPFEVLLTYSPAAAQHENASGEKTSTAGYAGMTPQEKNSLLLRLFRRLFKSDDTQQLNTILDSRPISAGDCLVLNGSRGQVTINLNRFEHISGISLGHLPVSHRYTKAATTAVPQAFNAECLCYEWNGEDGRCTRDAKRDIELHLFSPSSSSNTSSEDTSTRAAEKALWERRSERLQQVMAMRSVKGGVATYHEPITAGRYDALGPSFQTFTKHDNVAPNEEEPTLMRCDYVRLNIESNYGNPYYTSLYRVLVHPATPA